MVPFESPQQTESEITVTRPLRSFTPKEPVFQKSSFGGGLYIVSKLYLSNRTEGENAYLKRIRPLESGRPDASSQTSIEIRFPYLLKAS